VTKLDSDFYRYSGKGKVRYSQPHSDGGSGWILIDCPGSITFYYNRILRWLLHTHKISLPLHGAHITVVAGKYTTIDTNKHKWNWRDTEWVTFHYGSLQTNDEGYYWLPVYCKAAEEIRLHYGLTPTPKFQYHLTVGYMNN